MLSTGDIFELNSKRLLVCHIDTSEPTLEALVMDVDGCHFRVDYTVDTNPNCTIIGKPAHDWPFVLLPRIKWKGPYQVSTTASNGATTPLRHLYDWVVGEPLRNGGALYLHSHLRLRPKDRVLLTYEEGERGLLIPQGFGSLSDRAIRIAKKEEIAPTFYDRLLEDDD